MKIDPITVHLKPILRSGATTLIGLWMALSQPACEPEESWQSLKNRHQPVAEQTQQIEASTPSLSPEALLGAEEAFNTRHLEDAVAHMSKHVLLVEKSSDIPAISGRKKVLQHLKDFTKLFPDAKSTPLRILHGPGWVLSETHLTGSQSDDIGSLKNQQRRFAVRGAKMHRVEDGSVVEIRVYMDAPTVIKQLKRPQGLTIHRPPEPGTESPESISGPASSRLEENLRRFVAAWYQHDEKELSKITVQDIKYNNHLWHRHGTGRSNLTTHGTPMLWVNGERSTKVMKTYSSGNWAVAELVVTADVPGMTKEHASEQRRVSHLVLARFKNGQVSEATVYGSTLQIRQTLFGARLFPAGPAKNPPFRDRN